VSYGAAVSEDRLQAGSYARDVIQINQKKIAIEFNHTLLRFVW